MIIDVSILLNECYCSVAATRNAICVTRGQNSMHDVLIRRNYLWAST